MMLWADRLFALFGLAGFAAFLGVIVWFVREPALIIVVAVALLMAAYDFFIRPNMTRQRAERDRTGR